jgi:hypothetical protein
VKGTNKAHENGEAMGFVGVRLTARLGAGFLACFPCITLQLVSQNLVGGVWKTLRRTHRQPKCSPHKGLYLG